MPKKIIIVGGVLLVLCLAIVFLRFGRGGEDTWICDPQAGWVKHGNPSGLAPSTSCGPQTAVIEDNNTTSTLAKLNQTTAKKTTPKTTVKALVLSYTELVKKYEGYRFQFSNDCSQVSPNSFVIKTGYTFMLDNRENKEHIFTFDKVKYSVKPYGYAVVTAKSLGNQSVMCDGVQRAIVNVQK